MSEWRRNTGIAPRGISHVWVRLRNGRQPGEKWPVHTGRAPSTRWTLIGSDFDIIEWKAA